MATKRQVTLRFRDEYVRASKKQKGVILDRMCETLGIGRSTARRLLAQAGQHGNGAVPAARERPCRYSDQSRQLLVRVWVLMDMPCGKYLKAMLPQWLPVLRDCGELDAYDGFTFSELMAMSASTIDRYLKPLRDAARPKGLAATRPAGELLRNSITIRKASDELDGLPGNVEADTVAHCGPSLKGEFCRTLTVVDFATGWTENASARNNAYRNLSQAEAMIEQRLPFTIRSYDNDNGSEFINTDFITHLQQLDIQQTRSRPYRKNDQATVESRNNHVVRKFAFYWRYDTEEQRDLPDRLWAKTYLLLNLFTPTRKPARIEQGRDGRRRTVYDRPRTPWARVLEYDAASRADGGRGYVDDATRTRIENLIASTNPARLGREIAAIQDELERLSRERTEGMARRQGLDMGYLGKAIERMHADAEQDNK